MHAHYLRRYMRTFSAYISRPLSQARVRGLSEAAALFGADVHRDNQGVKYITTP